MTDEGSSRAAGHRAGSDPLFTWTEPLLPFDIGASGARLSRT